MPNGYNGEGDLLPVAVEEHRISLLYEVDRRYPRTSFRTDSGSRYRCERIPTQGEGHNIDLTGPKGTGSRQSLSVTTVGLKSLPIRRSHDGRLFRDEGPVFAMLSLGDDRFCVELIGWKWIDKRRSARHNDWVEMGGIMEWRWTPQRCALRLRYCR